MERYVLYGGDTEDLSIQSVGEEREGHGMHPMDGTSMGIKLCVVPALYSIYLMYRTVPYLQYFIILSLSS
jgi:hypothetical protein